MMEKTEFRKSLEISTLKAKSIPELVGTWWKEASKESGSAAKPGKLYAIGNYLVELTRSSLGDGKSDGRVTAIFDGEKIKVEIEAFSGEERQINLNVGGNYGMKEAIDYADDFTVESSGKRWEKAPVKAMLEETGDSEVKAGSKVTFVKYISAPPVEDDDGDEDEERFMGNRRW